MTKSVDRETRFRLLVNQEVFAAVWRYCYRLTGNRHDAEDLSQESLARAFQSLHQLSDHLLIKGWLFCIARTTFIDWHRKKRIATIPLRSNHHAAEQESDRRLQVLREAVEALPPLQREAIELFHFDELSLREAAIALRVSANTVKQRLHRARESLRRRMETSLANGSLEAL